MRNPPPSLPKLAIEHSPWKTQLSVETTGWRTSRPDSAQLPMRCVWRSRELTRSLTRLATAGTTSPGDPSTQDEPSVTELLCREVATPLDHVLRILAAECSTLCRDRRQLCLLTLSGSQGRATTEKLPPSPTQLFDGNIDAVLQTIKHRYEAGGAFKSSIPMRRRVRQYQQTSPRDESNGGKRVREDRKTGHASVTRYSHSGGTTNITSGNVGQPFRQQPYGAKRGRWGQHPKKQSYGRKA